MTDLCKPEEMVARAYTDICVRCNKPIARGHRVLQVLISDGRGVNPRDMGQRGLFISEEWEVVHVDCYDPYLRKRVSVTP
jgi:hypothetical protein